MVSILKNGLVVVVVSLVMLVALGVAEAATPTDPARDCEIESRLGVPAGDHADVGLSARFSSTEAVAVKQGDGSWMVSSGGVSALVVSEDRDLGKRGLVDGTVVASPVAPDFLEVGDWDGDGIQDLVMARRGGSTLWLMPGLGDGSFSEGLAMDLGGIVTGMTFGEFGLRDGVLDLAVAVVGSDGARVLVFSNRRGALLAEPVEVELPTAALDLVLADVDGLMGGDLVVRLVSELGLIRGSFGSAPSIEIVPVDGAVRSVTVGDVAQEAPARMEVVVLADDGLHFLDLSQPPAKGLVVSKRPCERESVAGEGTTPPWITCARVGSTPTEEVLVVDPEAGTIDVVFTSAVSPVEKRGLAAVPEAPPLVAAGSHASPPMPQAARRPTKSLEDLPETIRHTVDGRIVDVVPVRSDRHALRDLLVTVEGEGRPQIIPAKTATTYTVTTTADTVDAGDGVLSLREAVVAANDNVGTDTIEFAIPAGTDAGCDPISGVCTIALTGDGLPILFEAVTLDATTQTGYDPVAGTPLIVLNGTGANAGAVGLAVAGGGSLIRGFATKGFSTNSDVALFFSGGNVVSDNYFGVSPDGSAVELNVNGLHISGISGTRVEDNLFSGSVNAGVALTDGANGNTVTGNVFGMDPTLTIGFGNDGNDVLLWNAPGNTIGVADPSQGNVFGWRQGVTYPSIAVAGVGSAANVVQGNAIGTDLAGVLDLGASHYGIYVVDAPNTLIGGAVTGLGNTVWGREDAAILISSADGTQVLGNAIVRSASVGVAHGLIMDQGTANSIIGGRAAGEANTISDTEGSGVLVHGDAGVGNTIVGNAISGHGAAGINLCAARDPDTGLCTDGSIVTPNDSGDVDTGPNELQNFPVVEDVVLGTASTSIGGTINTEPNQEITVDVYANAVCDPSGHGQGESYLGSTVVNSDGGGDASFVVSTALLLTDTDAVVATATSALGSTSEFSACATGDDGLWVDFGVAETGYGTFGHPFATLSEALSSAKTGATVTIGNHEAPAVTDSAEGPLTINQGITIVAKDAAATLR